jgi:DNA repair exonuclease SbcCD ATPase subunit
MLKIKLLQLKRMIKSVLRHRTLLRLISLKVASMFSLAIFFSSCDNNFAELEEALESNAKAEKELTSINIQASQREAEVEMVREQLASQHQALAAARRSQREAEAAVGVLREQLVSQHQVLAAARRSQREAEAEVGVIREQLALLRRHQALAAARRSQREAAVGVLREQLVSQHQVLAAARRSQREAEAEVGVIREQLALLRRHQVLSVARQAAGIPRDVPPSWQAKVEDEDEDSRYVCEICTSSASCLMHGMCCCPNEACDKKICKLCYWKSIAAGQTQCPYCRSRPLNE